MLIFLMKLMIIQKLISGQICKKQLYALLYCIVIMIEEINDCNTSAMSQS